MSESIEPIAPVSGKRKREILVELPDNQMLTSSILPLSISPEKVLGLIGRDTEAVSCKIFENLAFNRKEHAEGKRIGERRADRKRSEEFCRRIRESNRPHRYPSLERRITKSIP